MYRKLDQNGDFVFGRGKAQFLQGASAVAQAIKTSLLLFQGEWWENLNQGVPMFQSILGQPGGNKSKIDRILQQAITAVQGVTGIQNIQTSLQNRQYVFYCVVNTIYSQVIILNSPSTIIGQGITILDGTLLGDGDGNILSDGGNTIFTP